MDLNELVGMLNKGGWVLTGWLNDKRWINEKSVREVKKAASFFDGDRNLRLEFAEGPPMLAESRNLQRIDSASGEGDGALPEFIACKMPDEKMRGDCDSGEFRTTIVFINRSAVKENCRRAEERKQRVRCALKAIQDRPEMQLMFGTSSGSWKAGISIGGISIQAGKDDDGSPCLYVDGVRLEQVLTFDPGTDRFNLK